MLDLSATRFFGSIDELLFEQLAGFVCGVEFGLEGGEGGEVFGAGARERVDVVFLERGEFHLSGGREGEADLASVVIPTSSISHHLSLSREEGQGREGERGGEKKTHLLNLLHRLNLFLRILLRLLQRLIRILKFLLRLRNAGFSFSADWAAARADSAAVREDWTVERED
jgi:hypothetical protein